MTGTLRVGWHSGYRITNNSASDKWYKLGKVFMPKENQQWVVEMTGKLTNEEISGVAGNPVTAMSSGTSYLAIYRCAKAIYADIRHYGLPAVLDIKFNRIGTTTSEIWVKLKANSGDTLFNLTSTGPTRFESGVCSLFTSDLGEVADLSSIGTVSPAARMSLHNGLAGVGANERDTDHCYRYGKHTNRSDTQRLYDGQPERNRTQNCLLLKGLNQDRPRYLPFPGLEQNEGQLLLCNANPR